MDLQWLRRQFIAALAADEELFERLVLKGGSALSLVHGIGLRASIDLDYSIENDVENASDLGARIVGALRTRLEPLGFVVFDESFESRPRDHEHAADPRWGGYTGRFKLMGRDRFAALGGDMERARRESLSVSGDPQAGRKFRIEISTFEYCGEKTEEIISDGVSCYVYTPQMIAAEKLRSLCQQMEEYGKRANPAPRARDFYDLHALLTEGRVELSEDAMHELVRVVFEAKEVSTGLLSRLEDYREFHRSDWPAVLNAIPPGRSRDYDFYVDFILSEVRKLQPLWEVDAP